MIRILLYLIVCSQMYAATYYVRTNGSNLSPGTGDSDALAWQTITYAETQITAGDTVYVRAGTYHEQPIVNISGSNGAYINFIGETNTVCRGFVLDSANYIRIKGFEITHTNSAFFRAIIFNGTCSYIEILDNYIHHTYAAGGAIRVNTDQITSYVTVRGNYIYFPSYVPNIWTNVSNVGISTAYRTHTHWLIEYNHLERCADFIIAFGTNHIIRNNYLHDYNDTYWGAPTHSDGFQPGSDGVAVGTRHQVYEANMVGDQTGADAHFGIWQDTVSAGDTNILIRGNVGFRNATGGIGAIGTDCINTYNNTFWQLNYSAAGGTFVFYSQAGSNCLIANSIIADDGLGSDAIVAQNGYEVFATHNLGYLAGSESSYISTADPLLTDPTNKVFTLQAGSPAIDAGTNVVWITSSDGSGTTFTVNNGQRLCDGFGITSGDIVTIGATTTRIISIDSHTVTVATSVTWTNLQPVYWNYDNTPDLGAIPFGRTNLVSAVYSTNTGTVTTVGDTRKVIQYRNSIPIATDYDSPYEFSYISGDTFIAYPLYATTNLMIAAVEDGEPPPDPPAPGGFRIRLRRP